MPVVVVQDIDDAFSIDSAVIENEDLPTCLRFDSQSDPMHLDCQSHDAGQILSLGS